MSVYSPFYVDVWLPLALPGSYTYIVPEELTKGIRLGQRVEVGFGKNKHYAGIVVRAHHNAPGFPGVKEVQAIIDEDILVMPQHLDFWQWIADYYLCTPGEVMIAAIPSFLRLESETVYLINPELPDALTTLSDDGYLIIEALQSRETLTYGEIQLILQRKTIGTILQQLIRGGWIQTREDLESEYIPRKTKYTKLSSPYSENPESLHQAFDLVKRSEKQTRILLAMIDSHHQHPDASIPVAEIQKRTDTTISDFQSLVKKEIISIWEESGNILEPGLKAGSDYTLTSEQADAWQSIQSAFQEKKPVLLQGVTGSGKTHLYAHCIKDAIGGGGQVLYMCPEIALTTQLIKRLEILTGIPVFVFHSKASLKQRAEAFTAARNHPGLFVTARSGIFLPFTKLTCIIVDEEHDASYKQSDPAPRYHARDVAIYLARTSGANILLGSATPSLETYQRAISGKYQLIQLPNRYGSGGAPDFKLITYKDFQDNAPVFSKTLLDAIQKTVEGGKQVILFRNRRGYAPLLTCTQCSWVQHCNQCDVPMTWHQWSEILTCHYCTQKMQKQTRCPECGNEPLLLSGFGTEKAADELQQFFPKLRIARLDTDTARTSKAIAKILDDFGAGEYDVLIGTQMVTKGLDFANVQLVGILAADGLFVYPDFRSNERAFQLMYQVGGRAGRTDHSGQVLIQARFDHYPILQDVLRQDWEGFYRRELEERTQFHYPPYTRIIQLRISHPDVHIIKQAAQWLFQEFQSKGLPVQIQGPVEPMPSKVRNQYLREFQIKCPPRQDILDQVKKSLLELKLQCMHVSQFQKVRFRWNVDPA